MGYDKIKVRVSVIVPVKDTILLIRQQHNGSDYWIVPGGGVEPGETLAEAAVREVEEETGIKVTIKELAYIRDFIQEGHVLDIFMLGEFKGGILKAEGDSIGHPGIVVDARFVKISEMSKLNLFPRYFIDHLESDLKMGFNGVRHYIGKCP